MKGWQIFVHSVRQVFGNLPGALRVSAVPYVVMNVLILLVGSQLPEGVSSPGRMGLPSAAEGDMMVSGPMVLATLLLAVVAITASLWIVVSWHRYVLLNELAPGLPPFRGDLLWAYFRRSLWIGILMVPVALVYLIIVAFVSRPFLGADGAAGSFVTMTLISAVLTVPLAMIVLRLSAALPAAALDRPTSVGDAWQATAGETETFAVLAISLVFVSTVSNVIGQGFAGSLVLSVVWSFVTGWVLMMLSASVLTTLYGHYIEKRALV